MKKPARFPVLHFDEVEDPVRIFRYDVDLFMTRMVIMGKNFMILFDKKNACGPF